MLTGLNEMHQSLAVTLNQKTWTLLERKDRTDKDNHRMIAYAVLGLLKKMNKCLLKAKTTGSKIKKNEDKKLFFSDFIVCPGTSVIKLKNNIIIDNKIKNIFGT
ncbi:uncharacterized protein METZ01_LOCUS346402 [marine metagenome]|jgi:hypothetical protein|uniref:Uncharacterized protein n=1 Tax=marine metagenome TaxID=408172 RepID=A0A382R958_9ZZZZ|tara:strand:- start:762 stop:1073 length:312 start_codon:yes stop_codon:yes gene_type:complete